jgi:hypothetical protein
MQTCSFLKKLMMLSVILVSLGLGLVTLQAQPDVSFGKTYAYPVFGFAPQMYKNRYEYGQGVFFAPYDLKVYAEPSDTAAMVEHIVWAHNSNSTGIISKVRQGVLMVDKTFISYYPSLDVAMMTVVSENGDGWAEVVIDHQSQKTGWVKLAPTETAQDDNPSGPSHFGRYQTWQEFMKLNAKASGIYWLNGVSSYNKQLRTAPEDGAKIIPVTVVKDVRVKHVRGNWMLVEIKDFDHQNPIGWIRWRDEAGRLMVFTNFSQEYMPILSAF